MLCVSAKDSEFSLRPNLGKGEAADGHSKTDGYYKMISNRSKIFPAVGKHLLGGLLLNQCSSRLV